MRKLFLVCFLTFVIQELSQIPDIYLYLKRISYISAHCQVPSVWAINLLKVAENRELIY